MLSRGASYQDIRAAFRWNIPEYYNIGADVCDKWAAADPSRVALINVEASGHAETITFSDLRNHSNRLANMLRSAGVSRGSRIGILLPQSADTASAHIATYKLGAIAVPLFALFGPDALGFRLKDAGVETLITNSLGFAKLASSQHLLPDLKRVYLVDQNEFRRDLAAAASDFDPVRTRAEDPALIIYTSGTTGMPKGALHAHRVLLGHLPGVEISHDFFPQAGDRIWTPADWAWIGGLLDVLLPALHHRGHGRCPSIREIFRCTSISSDRKTRDQERFYSSHGSQDDAQRFVLGSLAESLDEERG
jgi:acetyl-CoA synthetase